MPITSHYLGLDAPALESATDFFLQQYRSGQFWDLTNVVVVVPGGRAGRRLLEVLALQAAEREIVLSPPEIVTVGALPEVLYQPQRPFADDLTQRLVWAEALQSTSSNNLRLIVARPPNPDDLPTWLDFSKVVQQLHRELASNALSFSSVLDRASDMSGFAEFERWRALADVQQRYLDRLDQLGLWDRQTARTVAIQQRECQTDRDLILLGTADMDRSMRQMLDQVADRVTTLIHAPKEWNSRFDSHGCLIAAEWTDVPVPLEDEQIHQADSPDDQVSETIHLIAELNESRRADEITVGVADESLVPNLQRQFSEFGLPCRWGPGESISTTPTYRLMQVFGDFVQGHRFHDFASLGRHPDVVTWLEQQGVRAVWLDELDEYFANHLPTRVTGNWLGHPERSAEISKVQQLVEQLSAPFASGLRPLVEWTEPLQKLLTTVYGDREIDTDQPAQRDVLRVCQAVADVMASFQDVPVELMPKVSGGEAIHLVAEQLSGIDLAPPQGEEAIEILGWLELPLDDAKILIVTSFNEGFVPKSVNHDPFLPNRLRSLLGLTDNRQRLARDAYATSVMLAAWRKSSFVMGRRDIDGNPLRPSRLVFAAEEELVAKRAVRFFAEAGDSFASAPILPCQAEFGFDVPRPTSLKEPIERLSVTSFRSYLSCPYRFYLERVLRLSRQSDAVDELDGAAFGNLAHDVLQMFGGCPERHSTDAEVIEAILNEELSSLVRRRYGSQPMATISVQVEQLRYRLHAFAVWQAKWAEEGWRIEHAEVPESGTYGEMVVDGKPIALSGRIDRIDRHEESGERIILDYKTSDSGRTPEQTHRRGGEWVDLQLPLYRHLAATLGISSSCKLAYILLPKDTAKVGLSLAEWSDNELLEADKVAAEVVRRIRAEQFWPPTDPPPDFSEDFAGICLDGVFGKPSYETGEGQTS